MRPSVLPIVGAVAGLVLSGCAAPASNGVEPTSATSREGLVSADYLPGLAADLHLPGTLGPAPLVVLVPGGGWQSADPAGLVPLAEALATDGAAAATVTYSTTTMGATFPRPVDDVVCAVRWAAEQATVAGYPPSRVVVLGHSAGGHLGALVALAGDRFGADCPAPPVAVEGFIGLAGVYDVRALGPTLADFFGATSDDDPDTWNQGDPLWWVAQDTSSVANLHVLLVHGDADTTVPLEQSTAFAQALEAAGADVTTVVAPGQTHQSIYSSPVARPVITDWLDSWPG